MTPPSSPQPSQPVPFDAGHWRFAAVESRVEEHLGRQSLYLKGGIATVADVSLTDGAIEFDVAFTGERGFMGGVWRVEDTRNYEEFYLRPHQSGNPDANQYTPVFHGISGWQLYHGERYAVPVAYPFDEWIRVRIRFSGSQAEVFLQDLERPALFVEELKRAVAPGRVGVSAGNFAPAYFSNFSFTVADAPALQDRAGKPLPAPPGTIPSWWVSDVFPESAVEDRDLGRDDLAPRSWTRLAAERSGLVNLARVQGTERRKNTVFARQAVIAQREQVRRLDFGFCNRIRVYLNGRLLFRGDDDYRSRDYRFLGSIGYFDALYLPLTRGKNEIVMAVSEDAVQGGWGVQAKLEDLADLAFEE